MPDVRCQHAQHLPVFVVAVACCPAAAARQVLGIINRPGCFAEFITLPASNLHVVPDALTDAQAAFCEPLAAACRVLEQGLVNSSPGSTQQIAVVGKSDPLRSLGLVECI